MPHISNPSLKSEADTLAESYEYGTAVANTELRQRSMKTYLFGYPIAHSLAPKLHQTLFKGSDLPWSYSLFESKSNAEFLPNLRADDCIGSAVTMPHKINFMSEVDEVTEEGRVIGAINTIFLRRDHNGNKRYIGTNTDCIGVRESFLQNYPNILSESDGKPALVIGGGGACRSSIYALGKWLGASKIYLVNRLQSEVDDIIQSFAGSDIHEKLVYVGSVEEARHLESPVLVVGTVPDIPPTQDGEILARNITVEFLKHKSKGYILEMCYHPNLETTFFKLGKNYGWEMILGTEAMIYQGIAQQILWQEQQLSDKSIQEAKRVIRQALESAH
jgi:quinate dehydrogenase